AQLGEEQWRIRISGAPSLDTIHDDARRHRNVLTQLGFSSRPLVVAFHPATLEPGSEEEKVRTVIAALEQHDLPMLITGPNADHGSSVIRGELFAFARRRPDTRYVESLPPGEFVGALARSLAIVGNSSAALIEAPSLGIPAVNI